jgi:hypothetical protein
MQQFRHLYLLFVVLCANAQYGPVPSFFNIQRELPLVNLNTSTTISVADYGAVVNDGIDDTAAIINAIGAAMSLASAQNPVRLLFENGTYNLSSTSTNTHIITINGASNILWDGQNAEFMINTPTIGFLNLVNCTNFIVKDISVDYSTLPFTQGKITAVNTGSGFFEFDVDPGFLPPTNALFVNAPERWGMIKTINGAIKKGTANLIPANGYTFISGNKYRANNLSGQLTNIAVGDYFVHMARNNGRTIIRNNGGKNITYLNVTAYASPAGGFNAADSEEWNVLNCAIKLKSNRVHSINADCMHVNGGRIAPWVENSLFEGFADDCMNLKYIKRDIVTVHSPTEITVRNRVFAGEIMEFYNPVSGTFLGSVTVNNVIPLGNNLFRLTLSAPVNIQTVTDPEHQLSDKAYVESRSNQSFVFKNNIVRNSRRYGLLLQNKFALIEGNLFQNTSGSAIRIENGVDWGEGFRASNIVINNNVIDNCGFDRTYINEGNSAAIAVDFMRLGTPCTTSSNWCGTQTANWQAHSNISITNNRIIYNRRGLYLKNINGLTVHNNFICHSGQDITLSTGQNPIQQTILNCSNTSIINLNTTLPTSNVQFLLNETQPGEPIINSGSESGIGLQVNNNGGIITQGHWDTTVGHTVYINTQNNGSLNLINSDNSPFSGNVGGSARTFAFWVKPEEAIFQNFIITGGPANGSVLSVQMEANRTLRITDNNANIVRMSDMPLDLNVWNHVAISVPEGGTMFDISLYKNGVPSNETFSGTRAKINTTEAQMRLFPTFKGTVSDFRYFDYALCNGEVEQVYNDRYTNLSTDEVSLNNIKIYPTITNQMIHFSESIEMVEVFDLVGNKLFQEKGNIQQINVEQLSAGMYLIRMNQKETAKIIKK